MYEQRFEVLCWDEFVHVHADDGRKNVSGDSGLGSNNIYEP